MESAGRSAAEGGFYNSYDILKLLKSMLQNLFLKTGIVFKKGSLSWQERMWMKDL